MTKRSSEGGQEFQNIYTAFHEKIRRYLARLVGENEADDLTHEVLIKVGNSLKDFRGESQLSTWIYRIATNTAVDRLRSPDFRRSVQESLSVGEDETDIEDKDVWTGNRIPLPDQQLVRKEMNECIRTVVDRLPENYRTVIVLSELEELTNNEIAEILQVSLDTVKIRLHRSRERLKKELESHCTFYRDERNELACDRKTTPLKFLPR